MTLGGGYFDALYERRDDPWRLAERWYERRKRALTLGILPRERFSSALEVGCSIGALTAALAPRCTALLATDIAPRAVELARARVADHPGVTVSRLAAPDEWPEARFDLVVLSEVGYYLDESTLLRLFERSVTGLTDDGVLVACHWRHPVDGYPLLGDRVHELLRTVPGIDRLAAYADDDFVLESYALAGTRSVAVDGGLVPRSPDRGTETLTR